MAKIGYCRVSTIDQSIERQIQAMEAQGCEELFIEKLSGKSTDRPELQKMIDYIRRGDTIIIESISRLARNTADLLRLVDIFVQKEVKLVSLKENLDTETATGKFVLTMFGAVAQLERDYMLQRQKEGIAIAKANGKYNGRPVSEYNEELWERLYPQWKAKEISSKYFQSRMDMKPNTFYRTVKRYEKKINQGEDS